MDEPVGRRTDGEIKNVRNSRTQSVRIFVFKGGYVAAISDYLNLTHKQQKETAPTPIHSVKPVSCKLKRKPVAKKPYTTGFSDHEIRHV